MKRIYKEFSYGKELVGYDYKGYYIEITDELGTRNIMYGSTHKWYEVILKNGRKYVSDRLKEIKEKIDSEVK